MMTNRSLCFVVATLFQMTGLAARAQDAPLVYLDQGWNEIQRQNWYTTSQGSRLLPLAWFLALELAGGSEKLAAPANIRRYGYLVSGVPGDKLPLGFAVDTGPSPDMSPDPWVGMTCAACHTADITFQGKRVRVDGAATLADFQTFLAEMTASLKATNDDQAKFDKFAAEVLGPRLQSDQAQLKSDLQKLSSWYVKLGDKNRSPVRYGHARLDAQGHILNKVSLIVGAPQQLDDYPSDAPASYPFLWYTPKQERVQWNGLADQRQGLGGLPRNIGQVTGVFASIDVASDPTRYFSSVRLSNLQALEGLVTLLKPPVWPQSILPSPQPTQEGATLFRDNCARCHTSIDRKTGTKVEPDQDIAQMRRFTEIGTDIWLACNVFQHTSKAGLLEGRGADPFSPVTIGPVDKTTLMLTNTVIGTLFGTQPDPTPETREPSAQVFFGSRTRTSRQSSGGTMPEAVTAADSRSERKTECETASEPDRTGKPGEITLGYKGGPLHGIWATAPYLHNGSVPTLADLLKPAAGRTDTFKVGGNEFDPVKVGFKSDGPFEFHVRDADNNIIPGNDNSGHEFGTSLSKEQRDALLEYLKSL